MNPKNNAEHQRLQGKLVDTLNDLIRDRDTFNRKLIEVLNSNKNQNKQRIPQDRYPLVTDHIFQTLNTSLRVLKTKSIEENVPSIILNLIYTLIEGHSWITEFPETNKELINLANDCIKLLASEPKIANRSSSSRK